MKSQSSPLPTWRRYGIHFLNSDGDFLVLCETPARPHGWAMIRREDGPITAFHSRERAQAQAEEFALPRADYEIIPVA